jgi:hypothetical protein
MHKKIVGVFVGVVALLAAATSARAGFVDINVESINDPDGLIGVAINTDDGTGQAAVALGEVFEPGQGDLQLRFTGETDSDPIMTITKVIENTTGFEWIGYSLVLDPGGAATFVGTPVSNAFTFDAGASSATSLIFGPGANVPSGESATLVFDINVPSTGPFGFTLTQTPALIPEPTTLLMGLLMAAGGAIVSLRYRWG